MNNPHLLVLLAGLLASDFCAAPLHATGSASPKPNVLFIAVDDLNHWVGYLGRNPQTLTPNMDRLAKRGVWFTRSYCAAPVCNPSRAALMSGLRPGATGVYDNQENFQSAIPAGLTLTTQFRKAGYYVCGAGKIYHASVYRPEEWDDWMRNAGGRAAREEDGSPQAAARAGKLPIAPLNCRDEDMPDFRFVDYAVAQLNKKHDKPFFIACGLTKPHLPWSVPKKYYDKFPVESIQLPPYKEDDLEELYNEAKDPYEWTNLAKQPGEGGAVKQDLGKYLPGENKPPAKGGGPSEGAKGGGRKNQKKNRNP